MKFINFFFFKLLLLFRLNKNNKNGKFHTFARPLK